MADFADFNTKALNLDGYQGKSLATMSETEKANILSGAKELAIELIKRSGIRFAPLVLEDGYTSKNGKLDPEILGAAIVAVAAKDGKFHNGVTEAALQELLKSPNTYLNLANKHFGLGGATPQYEVATTSPQASPAATTPALSTPAVSAPVLSERLYNALHDAVVLKQRINTLFNELERVGVVRTLDGRTVKDVNQSLKDNVYLAVAGYQDLNAAPYPYAQGRDTYDELMKNAARYFTRYGDVATLVEKEGTTLSPAVKELIKDMLGIPEVLPNSVDLLDAKLKKVGIDTPKINPKISAVETSSEAQKMAQTEALESQLFGDKLTALLNGNTEIAKVATAATSGLADVQFAAANTHVAVQNNVGTKSALTRETSIS